MIGTPALEFDGVTVRYEPGAPPVLEGVTFALGPGEKAALLGLNGSGKTTLLMAAVGLVGHEGSIRVDGTAVERRALAEVRRKTGFLFNVPEDQILFPLVIEDAAFGLLRQGCERREAFRRAGLTLDGLGIGRLASQPTQHLSHGQKLRVALAGALVTRPPLLLLDEPTAGLDPPGRAALARVLDGLGAAMLIATHDLDFAARSCRRSLVLQGGRIADADGDLTAVRQAWGLES
jgi:cobalt/nickel transport system ATP-binding protein